ncbi:MAG: aspartate aminotransferase family protein, partial [Coriobacteriia bacterium]|nr:aspartate aminotransferase family protein [Coriobacteriia bacterium]
VAAELARPVAADIVASALSDGFVLNNTSPSTLRFLPPLVCTPAEIDTLLQHLHAALDTEVA